MEISIQHVIADENKKSVQQVVLQCGDEQRVVAVDHLIISHGFDMDQSNTTLKRI